MNILNRSILLLVAAFCVLIICGCKSSFKKSGAPFKIKGRVLDQYDNPVPFAPVAITLGTGKRSPSYKGQPGAILTDLIDIVADVKGYFVYDSTPRKTTFVGVEARDHWGQDGSLYWFTCCKNGLFGWEEGRGWMTDAQPYGQKVPPLDGISNGGPLTPEMVVTYRVSKRGGPEPMAVFNAQFNSSPGFNAWFGIDLAKGTVTDNPCLRCDLSVRYSGCESPRKEDFSVKITSSSDAGVQLYGPRSTMEYDRGEAPLDGYNQEVVLNATKDSGGWISNAGEVDDYKIIMFNAKSHNIYGGMIYTFSCGGNSHARIFMNPRGDRNLGGGTREFHADQIPMPLKEVPYVYKPRLDASKIEVIEDKAKGEVTVRGAPGAALSSEMLWIVNEDPEVGESKESYGVTPSDSTHAKADGSFEVKIKANLVGDIYLRVKYNESPYFEMLPLARMLKTCQGIYCGKVNPIRWP